MNEMVVKVLSVGLTLSQLFTQPLDKFKESFDPKTDNAEVERLLSKGCDHLMKEFDAQAVNFDAIFAMINSKSGGGSANKLIEEDEDETPAVVEKSYIDKLIEKLDPVAMQAAYEAYCKKIPVKDSPIKIEEVIAFYNNAIGGELPDVKVLRGLRFPEVSTVVDAKRNRITEIYAKDGRRKWVAIKDLPPYVAQAFISAEDQGYRTHKGIDMGGIIRAFSNNMSGASGAKMQGGSTITQQMIKNVMLTSDQNFERKIKELVLAYRANVLLSKDEILELYLNNIFLGRASWGIEMASQSYFGKSAKRLTVAEAAFLATLPKSPYKYNPDRNFSESRARHNYVLQRMNEDRCAGKPCLSDAEYASLKDNFVNLIEFVPPRRRGGFYFIDEINRQAKALPGVGPLAGGSFKVHATLDPNLQAVAEKALRTKLREYEIKRGVLKFHGPDGSIAPEMARLGGPNWQQAMRAYVGDAYDLPYTRAVVLSRGSKGTKVGLVDGRTMALEGAGNIKLNLYDVIFVTVDEKKKTPRANLFLTPKVQGAVMVMENRTGRVLAMVGGYSYGASEFNRVIDAARQPGSTLKPLIYLSGLQMGLQPNQLLTDSPRPVPGLNRGGAYWAPSNYEGKGYGTVTMRRALEKSLNRPTLQLVSMMSATPYDGLVFAQGVTQELGIYRQTDLYFPWILGFQPARMLDMVTAYATIANDGLRPTPTFIDLIERNGKPVYRRQDYSLQPPVSVDQVSYYQLKNIMAGGPIRGTSIGLKEYAGKIGGKTGTSQGFRDAWFIGFTNEITVGVWIGYDRAQRLGQGSTGGGTALPIAKEVFEAAFAVRAPEPLRSVADAGLSGYIVEKGIDLQSGRFGGNFLEAFRRNGSRERTEFVTQEEAEAADAPLRKRATFDEEGEIFDEAPPDDDHYPDQLNLDDEDHHPYQPGFENNDEMWRDRKIDPIFE